MNSAPCGERRLVFTDLDGTLLDHDNYSFEPAGPLLQSLEAAGIPVIPVTSKTCAEVQSLRCELSNGHPFITENGAAIFIPQSYFTRQPDGTVARDGYWVHEISSPRQRWLELLAQLETEFPGEFDYFYKAGASGIAAMTGLTLDKAVLANQRDYSEPVQWLGSESGRDAFCRRLSELGAAATQGGRFLSVSGRADKGSALLWLRGVYKQAWNCQSIADLAAGDSTNDQPMLEVASTALLVRSPHHSYPTLERTGPTLYSKHFGPQGWADGVGRWLLALGKNT